LSVAKALPLHKRKNKSDASEASQQGFDVSHSPQGITEGNPVSPLCSCWSLTNKFSKLKILQRCGSGDPQQLGIRSYFAGNVGVCGGWVLKSTNLSILREGVSVILYNRQGFLILEIC
jgi:hypothetical protein